LPAVRVFYLSLVTHVLSDPAIRTHEEIRVVMDRKGETTGRLLIVQRVCHSSYP
jgi:hypothetical protein